MPANPLATPSLILAALVLSAAAFLAWRQLLERRHRATDPPLSPGETAFWGRQDARRRRGTTLMGLIGLVIGLAGSINPRAGREEARLVFALWVLVGGLMVVMVALAFWDSLNTLAFSRSQRRAILRERLELLQDTRSSSRRKGRSPDDPAPETTDIGE